MCFLRRPQKLTKSSPSIWRLLCKVSKQRWRFFKILVAFLENMNFNSTNTKCREIKVSLILPKTKKHFYSSLKTKMWSRIKKIEISWPLALWIPCFSVAKQNLKIRKWFRIHSSAALTLHKNESYCWLIRSRIYIATKFY